MRRLRGSHDEAAFAQEIAFNRVRRDEDIGRFRMKMVLRGAEESKTFFGDFEIA